MATTSPPKMDQGSTIAIAVLSVVVFVAVIGFIVIGTMPPKIVTVSNPERRQRSDRDPTRVLVMNDNNQRRMLGAGGGGDGGNDAAAPTDDSGNDQQPMLGGSGLKPSSLANINAASPGTQYRDNVAMQPPAMSSAQSAVRNAFNLGQNSQAQVTQYMPNSSASPTVTTQVPPGSSDEERRMATIPALALNLNTGYLPPVIAHQNGPSMAHYLPSNIVAAGFGNDYNEDGVLASIDPESAAQLDKALALSGVPSSFGLDAVSYEKRKAAEIIRSLELTGAADPSIEQVLAASTPFIATQALLKRATDASGAIDRSIIIEPPMRFLYNNPGYRLATPGVTMSPVVAENSAITPGQEYYMLQTGCFDGQCASGPKTEPY